MNVGVKISKEEFEHAVKSFGCPDYDRNVGMARGKSSMLTVLDRKLGVSTVFAPSDLEEFVASGYPDDKLEAIAQEIE
jgi:hypothetical protein